MKNSNFIQRSIIGALSFLKDLIFAQEVALYHGFLQQLDPRIKLVTFLVLIIHVLFSCAVLVLLFFYALCLLLALSSKIRLGFFLMRTWIFIPLFSLFIAVPAIFNFSSPGEAIAVQSILGLKFTITRQGLNSALLFIIRLVTSVSFTVLLSITTKHFELLKVLRIFKIPQVFVMILGICYRYVYLFIEIIQNTYLAIKSRIGTAVHYKNGQNIAAWNIASLWRRSVHLSEEVYKAMVSRGYHGEALSWGDFQTKIRDWLWLIAVVLLTIMNIYLIRLRYE